MTATVGVYNRYWRSQGGGERYTGMVAEVLARSGFEVTLLSHDPIDLDQLGSHLGLVLSGCRVKVIADLGEAMLSGLTSGYDLLVNGSYMSRATSRAGRAIYLCYFPTPHDHDLASWRRWAIRHVGPRVRVPDALHLNYGLGWFPPEGGRRRRWTWTNGNAELAVAPGPRLEITCDVARVGSTPTPLTIACGDEVVAQATVDDTFTRLRFQVPPSTEPRTLNFTSDTFVPGGSDVRQLGVAVSRMRVRSGGHGLREIIGVRYPWLGRDPHELDFLDSYDLVTGVSQYTVDWIEKLWHHSAEVLYPPIQVDRLRPETEREKLIVSAGRFFAPGSGHSKRQLELVETFNRMVHSGQLPGWTLRLIGGCEPSQRGYLERVRTAARGLPVEIFENAPRALLEDTMNRASIQWSATGYGENDDRAPWASEHFGMTTVEAMAGGCVPIVIDKAGQREIVRDGVDGYRWRTLEELTEYTIRVAGDENLRSKLAESSVRRAQSYSDDAFTRTFAHLVEKYQLLP